MGLAKIIKRKIEEKKFQKKKQEKIQTVESIENLSQKKEYIAEIIVEDPKLGTEVAQEATGVRAAPVIKEAAKRAAAEEKPKRTTEIIQAGREMLDKEEIIEIAQNPIIADQMKKSDDGQEIQKEVINLLPAEEQLEEIKGKVEIFTDSEIADQIKSDDVNKDEAKEIAVEKIMDSYRKVKTVRSDIPYIESLQNKELILDITDECLQKIDNMNSKDNLKTRNEAALIWKLYKFAYYPEPERNRRLLNLKKQKIDQYVKEGRFDEGGLKELIMKGIGDLQTGYELFEKYENETVKKQVVKNNIKFPVYEPLLSKEDKYRILRTFGRDILIEKYADYIEQHPLPVESIESMKMKDNVIIDDKKVKRDILSLSKEEQIERIGCIETADMIEEFLNYRKECNRKMEREERKDKTPKVKDAKIQNISR